MMIEHFIVFSLVLVILRLNPYSNGMMIELRFTKIANPYSNGMMIELRFTKIAILPKAS